MALEAYINLYKESNRESDSATLQRIEALVQRLALDNAQLRADNRRLRKLVVNRDRGAS